MLVAAVAGMALLGWGEVAHARASRRRLGRGGSRNGAEALVVLGYRNRGRRANLINRYRVRAALRSHDPAASSSVLVFSGGAIGGEVPEAELMARYARDLGYTGPVLTETASRSTEQNIHNVIPLIEHADRLKIVSNSLHAEKARAYLWRLRPDLGERLVRAEEYRFGELILLKPVMALMGLRRLRELSRPGGS